MNGVCKWLGFFSLGLILATTACSPIAVAKVSEVRVISYTKRDRHSWVGGAIIGGLFGGKLGAVAGGGSTYSEKEKIFITSCQFAATVGKKRYLVSTVSFLEDCSKLHDGDLIKVVLFKDNNIGWPTWGPFQTAFELKEDR